MISIRTWASGRYIAGGYSSGVAVKRGSNVQVAYNACISLPVNVRPISQSTWCLYIKHSVILTANCFSDVHFSNKSCFTCLEGTELFHSCSVTSKSTVIVYVWNIHSVMDTLNFILIQKCLSGIAPSCTIWGEHIITCIIIIVCIVICIMHTYVLF